RSRWPGRRGARAPTRPPTRPAAVGSRRRAHSRARERARESGQHDAVAWECEAGKAPQRGAYSKPDDGWVARGLTMADATKSRRAWLSVAVRRNGQPPQP